MAPGSNDKHEDGSSLPNGYNEERAIDGSIEDRSKTARHPRWTKQETIVLIQGKKVVENRTRGSGRSAFGSDQSEPKWDSVASYCKQHGVNRRPVQCQKRWGNLLVDFRKIKRWESQVKEERESFWVMRNDSRKEMKLPGYFDREVYDVLDGVFAVPAVPLTTMSAAEEDEDDHDEVFDSNRSTAAEDGLFSDSEPSQRQEIGHNPEKEIAERQSPSKKVATQLHVSDTLKEKHPGTTTANGSASLERWKRRRLSSHVGKDTNVGDLLIKVLERNSSMLNTQLEAQNINCQLDREQKKEYSNNLIAAGNKLTDALLRIANKL